MELSLETGDLAFTKRIQKVMKSLQHHIQYLRTLCEFTLVCYDESIVSDPFHLKAKVNFPYLLARGL